MERIRIVCFGDSNTWGYDPATRDRYPEDIRWTGILQRELGDRFRVIPEGQNSRTIAVDDPSEGEKCGMKHIVPVMESQKPFDLLIIMLGTNDMKNKFGLSPLDLSKAMQLLIEKALGFAHWHMTAMPRVLLIAPPLVGDNIRNSRLGASYAYEKGIETSKTLAASYRALAEHYGIDFMDASQFAEASSIDSIHMTPEAHEAFAREVLAYVRAHFPEA